MSIAINLDDLDDATRAAVLGQKPEPKAKPKKERKKVVPEKDFQKQFLQFAKLMGWHRAHFRPGMNQRGTWQTAVAGDGVGFPDVVLVRERVVWIELKSDVGTLSEEQEVWRDKLLFAKQEWYCWKPKDWPTIQTVLAR